MSLLDSPEPLAVDAPGALSPVVVSPDDVLSEPSAAASTRCPTCSGVGSFAPSIESTCPVCQGCGHLLGLMAWVRQQAMDEQCAVACPVCEGTRTLADAACPACFGLGSVSDYSLAID